MKALAYTLLSDLREEIDGYYSDNGIPPQKVEVNRDLWDQACSLSAFPSSVYESRVVCGQTVWPVSNVKCISVT